MSHHQPIHSLRPSAHRGAQAGGTELQAAVEAHSQLAIASGAQTFQLLTHVLVSLGGQPAARHAAEIAHGKSVRNSISGRGPTWEITSAAAIAPSRPHSASDCRRV